MERGSDPSEFRLAAGESVTIRIVAVGTGQLETLDSALERLEGDAGPGNVYRYTAGGKPGDLEHLTLRFEFPEKLEPPSRYTVAIEGPGGRPSLEAPTAFQPETGAFPQTLSYALTFSVG